MRDTTSNIAAAPGHPRVRALDGLRGFAITLVLIHTFDIMNIDSPLIFIRVSEQLLGIGWIGVHLFFVLSGYLITGILLDTKHSVAHFRNFFARRSLRIFPLYYAVLISAALLTPILLNDNPIWRHELTSQPWIWLYLTNWVEPFSSGTNAFSHFWSLAVEEQFYLIWPFAVYRLTARQVLKLSLAIIAAAFFARLLMSWMHANPEAIYMFTVTRMDALAGGASVSALMRSPELLTSITKRVRSLAWCTLLLTIVGAWMTHGYTRTAPITQTIGYLILTVAFSAVVFLNASDTARPSTWNRIIGCPILVSIGKYSYAMYIFGMLLHKFIGLPLIMRLVPAESQTILSILIYIGFLFATTYLLALLSYHAFERHFLAAKRHFE